MTLDQVKAVYRDAIDGTAEDHAGDSWWASVADEVTRVIAAPTIAAAAAVIGWWHADWSSVSDTPDAAARRIRASARRFALK